MHQPKFERSPKNPHVLRWVREQLGLTQFDVARMIGSSQPTVQSIELGRLKLSERLAYKLQARLGLSAKWLQANNWQYLPEPEKLLKAYRQAQGFVDQSYGDLIALRLNLLRNFLLSCAIVEELGWHGCNATGFHKIYDRTRLELLGTIVDKKLREAVYQKFIDETGDPVKVAARAISYAQGVRQAFKKKASPS
jgi:transcriptional regulator with XRE-family HTH domain